MLHGFRVIELATFIAAPSAAGLLADWGADVIKVEGPAGDPARINAGLLSDEGPNPVFEFDNRGKRGICLDITQPDGRSALLNLIAHADAFVTNLRPGALERAGLTWEIMREINPRLIYASVTGFGLEGADANRPGFDIAAFWSRAGVANLMIPKGQEPFPLRTGLGDHSCGLATALGIMTAAYERERTGVGRLVETSLLRSGVYAVGGDLAIHLRYGRVASTRGRRDSPVPMINFFQSRDGRWVCLMPRTYGDWPKIATAAGRPELADDPRFATLLLQKENAEALVTALDEGFGKQDFAEMSENLTRADLVWSPVQTPAEVVADPQAAAAGCFVDTPDGLGGHVRQPASPVRFHGAEAPPRNRAPVLGEHTAEVLAEFGIDPPQLQQAEPKGAVA